MIPTTQDAPSFITRRPAWEQGVELGQAMKTDIHRARAGLEQRQQRQQRGKFTLEYQTFLDAAKLSGRGVEALGELDGALIVPFWCEPALTTTDIIADVFTIDRTPDADWFAPGDFVFFDSPSEGEEFREIASTAGSVLTLVPGGSTDFASGTRVYPCRRCIYAGGRTEWTQDSREYGPEKLSFATL